MPFSTARPAAAASSVFGTAPMPMTTRSAGMVLPSARTTASIGDLGDARAEVEADALGDVAGVQRRGDLGRHAAGQQPRQRLDDRDLGAELARRGGELEADEAAADHREVPARAERGADAGGVVERAQHATFGPSAPGSGSGRGRAPVASSRRS